MKKKLIRGVALNLTLIQLFSQQLVLTRKKNNGYISNPTTKTEELMDLIIPSAKADELVLVDSDNSIYQRIDDETGKYRPISIFDMEITLLYLVGVINILLINQKLEEYN